MVAIATKFETKMSYNLASVKDICEIYVSIGGFRNWAIKMLPIKFYHDWPWLPWQQNLRQNWL